VAPNDPGSLAQAILTALGDEALRLHLAQAGRERARERFSWPVTARATAEQYCELLAC
jgi:glycosyltransferase involved in cell wall biosynthesis